MTAMVTRYLSCSPLYRRLWHAAALITLAVLIPIAAGPAPAGAATPGALNITLNASRTTVPVGNNVTFNFSASPPAVRDTRLTSVALDYGDGASSTVAGPFETGEQVSRTRDHAYASPGDYTATVTATASDGETNSASQTIHVTGHEQPIGGLDVSLSASPTSTPAGQAVSFSLTASPPSVLGGRIDSLSLDFGDGVSVNITGPFAAGQQVTRTRDHTYTASGDYTAIVTANAANGDTKSASQTVHVTGGAPIGGLTVQLSPSSNSASTGQPVTFSVTATPPSTLGGSITSLVLAFGDGARNNLGGPFGAGEQVNRSRDHAYTSPGDYTASVTATASNGETRTASQTITVTGNQPPIGGLTVNLTASPLSVSTGQLVSFNASASPPSVLGGQITNMSLDYGDGGTANLGDGVVGDPVVQTLTHAYAIAGSYTAILTATASTGDTSSASQTITVFGSPTPTPTPAPNPAPGGMSVSYGLGWNIVAGPSGTVVTGNSGPLYTFQAGSVAYQTLPNGSSLTAGQGYWAFFPQPATSTMPFVGPQRTTVFLPAGQWVMIGNPGSTAATVIGADVVYAYAAGPGYQATTILQPGQGAWALSFNGTTITIANS